MTGIASDLLKVAKDVLADGMPAGLSERGKEAYGGLQAAILDRQIYNVDYEEIKVILSRNFETVFETFSNANGLDRLSQLFLYRASNSLASLQSIAKIVRDIKAYIRDGDKNKELLKAEAARNEEAQQVLDQWDAIVPQIERYVKNMESWTVVPYMLKVIKPHIIKGRKPVERDPSLPGKYIPPLPSAQAESLVKAKLQEIVEPQKAALIEKMTKQYVDYISGYEGGMTYSELKKFLEKGRSEQFMSLAFESTGYKPTDPYVLSKGFEAGVKAAVVQGVQDMIASYVFKNVRKIAPIIHTKGEPSSAKVSWGNLVGWGFAGTIRFEFPDGTAFTVNNQAVMKFSTGGRWSGGGRPFYQFPTTFHNVKFLDGSTKSMVPEQAMNEVWAKEQAS